MKNHTIRVTPPGHVLKREDELAWLLAATAVDPAPLDADVQDMVINRIIDSVAVAIAGVTADPVVRAQAQALAHPRGGGAGLIGHPPDQRVHAEWAAWANGTAVRHLDWSDAFGAMDYSHPSDTIAPVIAVAQQAGRTGADVVRGTVAAYESQIALTTGINLHDYGVDQVAHLGPAVAAGVGALLDLPVGTVYEAVQQAAYLSTYTRQVRTGEISTWKANAPGHVGKLAVEAVDRALRGERSPSPVYEGGLGEIAVMLGGTEAVLHVPLAEPGEPRRAMLQSFPKQWAAEYAAQPYIDLAFRMRTQVADLNEVDHILVIGSYHMNSVIGSSDPEKFNPDASRGTLDHSLMYILAVALEDGTWDYETSYASERAHRPETIALWRKIRTTEGADWTRWYHEKEPAKRRSGGRIEITLKDGSVIADQIDNPNAANYPTPWRRSDYIEKFRTLTERSVDPDEIQRFLDTVQRLPQLSHRDLVGVYPAVQQVRSPETSPGIF
jgi:2-methylcitrate dehydratase